ARQHRFAPGVVALAQHFGIALGKEAVAQPFELGAQFGVVVDSAVEDHREAQRRIDHRLARGLAQIHDLQPAVPHGHRAGAMEAARIGAARGEVLSDAFDRPQVGGSIIETKFSSYATHENPYLYWEPLPFRRRSRKKRQRTRAFGSVTGPLNAKFRFPDRRGAVGVNGSMRGQSTFYRRTKPSRQVKF